MFRLVIIKVKTEIQFSNLSMIDLLTDENKKNVEFIAELIFGATENGFQRGEEIITRSHLTGRRCEKIYFVSMESKAFLSTDLKK